MIYNSKENTFIFIKKDIRELLTTMTSPKR